MRRSDGRQTRAHGGEALAARQMGEKKTDRLDIARQRRITHAFAERAPLRPGGPVRPPCFVRFRLARQFAGAGHDGLCIAAKGGLRWQEKAAKQLGVEPGARVLGRWRCREKFHWVYDYPPGSRKRS